MNESECQQVTGIEGIGADSLGESGDNREVTTLAYASVQPSPRQARRILRRVVVVVAAVAVGACANAGLDFGDTYELCANCGARSTVQELMWCGIGGTYNRRIKEGPISKFLQRCDQAPCVHRWKFCDRSGGDAFFRYDACGRGGSRAARIQILEQISCLPIVLTAKTQEDPEFPAALRAQLVQGQGDEDAIFNDLYERAVRLAAKHPHGSVQ